MSHEGIRYPGGISGNDLGKDMKLKGGSRQDAVRRAVGESYKNLLRKYPDINKANVLVDVYDMPGASAVTWTFHTGDRVVSVLAQSHTKTYGAAEFCDPAYDVLK